LAELLPEKLIAATWEEYNSGTFLSVVEKAARVDDTNNEEAGQAFQSILRAMELAYFAKCLGHEVLPRTKVNILHGGLYKIARSAGYIGFTQRGFSEFLDDLCPCGLKSHGGAVKKLASRNRRFKLPAS
jgi:hypothetical protein